MKKVLFASTALVMTAGVAAAEVKLSGSANMGLYYNGTSTIVINEIDVDINASAETDGGIALGASLDLDGDHRDSATNTTADSAADTVSGSTVNDPEVFISYNGLKLTVGDIGEASDVGGLKDVGFDGVGVDDVAEIASFGSHDVRVDYAFGDIAVAASVDSSNSDWAVGASGSFGDVSFAVGFGETTGVNQTLVTVGYTAGAFGGNIFYNENGAVDGMGIDVSYTTGDVTVTAVYAESGAADAMGVGVAYDLGGATLAGGIADVNGTTMADLGISFGF